MAVSILGEAAVRLRPDTSRFGPEAERGVMSPLGGIVKKAAGLFAAVFVGREVIGGLKSFYDAAAESAKIGRLTENVIRSTGGAAKLTADQVGDLATAVSNKTGMDDEAIQSGENLLLTFTNIRNSAGRGNDIFSQTTQIMTDMAAALGTDASGSAIQLGKALNDPVRGVSALSKVGVSFTAQQKDQIKTMVAAGDTMGAQKIILAELNKEFGGAAAAASTPLDKLKVNLGNVQEALGANLIPVANQFAGFAVGTLIPAFNQVSGAVGQAFTILFKGDFTGGPLAEDSGIVDTLFKLRDGFIQFYNSVVTFTQSATFAAWVQIAKDAAAALWSGLQTLAGFVTNDLVPAFLGVLTALGQVAEYFRTHQAAAVALGIAVGIVAALVVAAWTLQVATAIWGAATSVASWVAVAVGAKAAEEGTARSTAQIVFGWIAHAAAAIANAAVVVAQYVWLGITAVAQGAVVAGAWVAAQIRSIAAWVAMAASSAANAIAVGAVWLAQTALSTAATIAGWVAAGAATLVSWVGMAAAASANAIAIGAVWMAQTLMTTGRIILGWAVAVATVVAGWVVMGVQSMLQAARMAAAWLIALGPIGWIIAAVIGIVALIIANWDKVKTFTVNAFHAVVDTVVGVFHTVVGAVSSGISNVISFFSGLPGRILGALSSLGGLLVGAGRSLMQGFVNGIGAAASFVGGAARNIVNAVIGFVNSNLIDGLNSMLEFTIAGIHINAPDIPHIPRLHEGGVFTASAGEGLALLRNRELVATPEQQSTADGLLRALLDGTGAPAAAAVGAGTGGGGITIEEHLHAAPGESLPSLAARVTQGVVWNLNAGITRPAAAGAR